MNAADAATWLALVAPTVFAVAMFIGWLVWTNHREDSFAAEFIPEQADVAADVQAIDEAMLAALMGRTA